MSDGRKLIFRLHALQRMIERSVSVDDVRAVLANGDVIRDDPDDVPYPSRLVLGFVAGRPVHVVAADVDEGTETVVITVYEPAPSQWEPDFRTRRQP